MKIVHVETLVNCGPVSKSKHWKRARAVLHEAIVKCAWPPGSRNFTIYPESGKKRYEGNGVIPIKMEFVNHLRAEGWTIEGRAKNQLGQQLGDFDAVLSRPEGIFVAEWETGNISSSHRSMNKLTMLIADGEISAGTLVIPSRKLYKFLTDRIGNDKELEPYYRLWRSVPCANGVLEVVVIEHDATSTSVPRIPKISAGRALG
ncbi:MAG: hypothetical protein ABI693_11775 [Bryobacteraceae bacterium]